MIPIIATINRDEKGSQVANLQDALLALFALPPERGIFRALDAPKGPTLAELQKLTEILKQERDQSHFGDATQQLVKYFQIQQLGEDNPDGVVDDKTAAKLNEILKSIGVLDNPEPTPFVVRGLVTGAGKDQVVRAFDKHFRGEEFLGESSIGPQGYEIRYIADKFLPAEKGTPDLRVAVRDPDGRELVSSDIHYNAGPETTIDLTVDPGLAGPSEYESYLADLAPVLQGVALTDIDGEKAEDKQKDLDFLAGDTGIDRQHIAWLVLAAGFEAKFSSTDLEAASATVPAAAFYSWFRLGLSVEPGALWATQKEKLVSTLDTAITQGIIPANIGADLAGIAKRIEQIELDRVLQVPVLGTAAPLRDLLDTLPAKAKLNLDQQRVLAAAVNDLRPDDPLLVDQIKKAGFDGDADGVARTLRLGALTAGHLPLVQALQSRFEAGKGDGTLKPLAALRPHEWLDQAYTYGTPERMTITPVAYAEALSAYIEQQYPAAALAAHLTDGRRLAQHPALAEVGTFLSANPEFDIVTANINAVADTANLDGVKQPDKLVEALWSLQRMNTLGASLEERAALFENDFYASHQILAAGPTQLAATLDGRIAPERAAAIYNAAENLHNVTFAAFTAAFAPLNAPRIFGTNLFGNPPGTYDGPGAGLPVTDSPDLDVLTNAVAQSIANNHQQALSPAGFTVPHQVVNVTIPDQTVPVDWGPIMDHQPTL